VLVVDATLSLLHESRTDPQKKHKRIFFIHDDFR
jgi:hypothetical protein